MSYMRRMPKDVSVYDPSRCFNGYTLFATMWGTDAWLVDMEGRVVHHWEMATPPAGHGVLLPNGNLLWQGRGAGAMTMAAANGTEIIEVDWDGNEVWRYDDAFLNHDFVRLPNQNTLLNRNVQIPDSIASRIKGGIPGTEREGKIWSCSFREITHDGDIVWEWNNYEHLDPDTDELCPLCHRGVWGYTNALDVLSNGDVLCTFRLLNTVAIIDRKKNEIVWRWGPEQALGHPHSCKGLPNGNILIFDNGLHRKSKELGAQEVGASRIVEVNPITNEIEWEYKDPNAPNFYSSICSGTERLPNENTLVCEATKGRIFEVTRDKKIVWDYRSPFLVNRPPYWGWTHAATIFKAHRYGVDYEGLRGRTLDPDRYEWVIRKKDKKTMEEQKATERSGY